MKQPVDQAWAELEKAFRDLGEAVKQNPPFHSWPVSLFGGAAVAYIGAGIGVLLGGATAMQAFAATMCVILGLVLAAIAEDARRNP